MCHRSHGNQELERGEWRLDAVIKNMRLPVVSLGLLVSEKEFPVLVSRELRRQSGGFPGGPARPMGSLPMKFPLFSSSAANA